MEQVHFFPFRIAIHYFLHLIFPAAIAYIFFRKEWRKAYLVMLATMLVDADHLLSNPIFAPDRFSINYHFLHTYWAMVFYVLLLFFKDVPRMVGVGLLFHMLTDFIDFQLIM